MSSTLAKQQEFHMLILEMHALETKVVEDIDPALFAENNKRNRKAKHDAVARYSVLQHNLTRLKKELGWMEEEKIKKAAEIEAKAEEAHKKLEAKRPQPRGILISCCDCNANFFFGDNERAFYDEKGLAEPKRCRDCRKVKKEMPRTIQINCDRCKEDFPFSAAKQAEYKEKKNKKTSK